MRVTYKVVVFLVVTLVGLLVTAHAQDLQSNETNTTDSTPLPDNSTSPENNTRPQTGDLTAASSPEAGMSGHLRPQLALGCSVDDFVNQLTAGRFTRELDVSGCQAEKDVKLAQTIIAVLKKRPLLPEADALIRLVQTSYKGVNDRERFASVVNRLRAGLAATPLAFSPGGSSQNLLDPLIEILRTTLPTTNSDIKSEQLGQNISRALKNRLSEIQTTIDNHSQEIQTYREQVIRIDSALKTTQTSVAFTEKVVMVITAVILLSFGLLVYLIIQRLQDFKLSNARIKDDQVYTLEKFETRLTQVESTTRLTRPGIEELMEWRTTLTEELMHLEQRIKETKFPAPPSPPSPDPEGLARFNRVIDEIKGNINTLFRELLPLKDPTAPSRTALLLELSILREAWSKFLDNKEIVAALEKVKTMGWGKIQEPLLSQLPPVIPEELRPTFDTIVSPVRDFHNLRAKITAVQLLLNDELPTLSEEKALMRAREFINLLTMIQNSNLVADRLNFRLDRWIEDQFLGFADLYLQKHQMAQMENDGGRLAPGLEIVCQILKVAALEPIDLTLGVTPFDSTRHIGRSTTCDSNFANGVIVGVVRNGFLRGGQPLRQPEVIVNRVG